MNKIIIEPNTLDKVIKAMTYEILNAYPNQELPLLVGIHTRGAILAVRLAAELRKYFGVPVVSVGFINISFYRDDLSKVAPKPMVNETQLPFSIEGKKVLLIDDVLYTGRTIHAAIETLHAIGRPSEVKLAVLIDRGHRELPIEANFVGRKVQTTDTEVIHVHFEETDNENNVELSNTQRDFQDELDATFPIYCIRCGTATKLHERYGFDSYVLCQKCADVIDQNKLDKQ